MTEAPVKRSRGRPKGTRGKNKIVDRTMRVRAHQIFQESRGLATIADIERQLRDEGSDIVTAKMLVRWKREDDWAGSTVTIPDVGPMGERLRQAIQVRVPDDLNRVEQASLRLAGVVTAIADHVTASLANVKMETAADLEVMTRAAGRLLEIHLIVGKGLQDLRLLRVSSNFRDDPDKPRDGEVIPPTREAVEEPMSEQEAVLSRWDAV